MNKLQLLLICTTLSLTFGAECTWRSDFDSAATSDWSYCNWENNVNNDDPASLQYDCNGAMQWGGYGNFGSGTTASTQVTEIPDHYQLIVEFDLLAIDSWDDETFYTYVDGALLDTKTFSWSVGEGYECGVSGWLERSEHVYILVDHSADTANIELTSNLDEATTNESWGISNFKVTYLTSNDACEDFNDKFCNGDITGNFCTIRSDFDQSQDSANWHTCNWPNSFSDDSAELIYDCAGDVQFGGYGQFGKDAWAQTEIIKIPDHTHLGLKFRLHAIDSWDTETFYLYVDGALAYEETFYYLDGDSNDCGAGWLERESEVYFTVEHTASTATIYATSNLDEGSTNESWGLSNFVVEYVTEGDCETYDELDRCNDDLIRDDLVLCPLASYFDQLTAQLVDGLNTDDWVLDQDYDNPFTVCDQNTMLGGYGTFGSGASAQTTLSDLPAHSYLHIKFIFWSVDSWDNEWFYTHVDDVLVIEETQSYNDGDNICGAGWNERINYMDVIITHTADSATIKFSSSLDQGANDESWGISDVIVEYYGEECAWGYDGVPTTESLFGTECLVACQFGQEQVENFETSDTTGWEIVGADTANIFNTCGADYSMIGGYGIFGSGAKAIYTNTLPDHQFVGLSFQAFIGDSWDTEFFQVYIDGVQVKNEDFVYNAGPTNDCGAGWTEQYYSVELYAAHTNADIEIAITSTLDQGSTDENWGFSDYKLTYFTDGDCGDYNSGDTCWFNVQNCDVVTVYEFCDYTGRRAEVDGSLSCIDFDPQAICVPAATSATIYDSCWFVDDQVEFTENTACFSDNYELLATNKATKKTNKKDTEAKTPVVKVNF